MKNLNRYYMTQFKLDLTRYWGELGLYSTLLLNYYHKFSVGKFISSIKLSKKKYAAFGV